ncbi:PrpF domain-containing protein [Actinoplanes palleronii]|uniref:FldA protein n=1 Tax=Actinoplanes palleronii TaxID=113570 RepID=A0ABQ4BPT8_9ACTN|nr:PrpF domain-containing protein [Actinoplanes palleronii]GIE72693.1 FldA protein [Actinoplanes palleronii]
MLVRSGVSVLVIRSGTVQGAYFRAGELPAAFDAVDVTAVVVGRSAEPGVDVDCEFPGGAADRAGLLAGAGVFALERGLVAAGAGSGAGAGAGDGAGSVPVRVRMAETGVVVTVHVPDVPGGGYAGDTAISGVPGTAARVLIEFADGADAALLPTGRVVDDLGGVPASLIGGGVPARLIGAGVPVVLVAAAVLGVTGYETPARLEYDDRLRAALEALRLRAGRLLGLGAVMTDREVPELCLLAPPVAGGGLCVRMVVRGRVQPAIGFRSALSVAAAAALPGSVAAQMSRPARVVGLRTAAVGLRTGGVGLRTGAAAVLRIEHPTGFLDVQTGVPDRPGANAVVTTARPLLDGQLPRL